ncbi:Rv0361 family membrane protein [Propionibacterium australiense]|uniref:Uncharacterized protein n=1 Tax=Propionibacterium australiense TaxID=119981 RepID=A0A383S9K7_9ACTN|nr:hypothetical protein [Propionibacterium australiense]SYZ34104.1 Hypothetical protein PROPAUS_2106 [Propionibacterium australiense]VEH88693.1 Uncharacterised protein [Propionibacterium australiense]
MSTPQQPGAGGAGQNNWANQPSQPNNGWQPGQGVPNQGPMGNQGAQPQNTPWQQAQQGYQPQPQQGYGQPGAQQPAAFAAQGPTQPNPAQQPQQGPWPGQANAYPGQANAYPGAGPAQPGAPAAMGSSAKPKPAKLIIIIVSIILALIVGTVLAITLLGGSNEKKAKQTVEDYLTAISQGDADKARSYLLGSLLDTSLLTNEVLKDSNERAPMTNVAVEDAQQVTGSDTQYQVPVSYTIDDTTTRTKLLVTFSSGNPFVDAPPTMPLSLLDDVEVRVNGVSPDSDSPYVFPGNYTITTDNEYLMIKDGEIEVYDPTEPILDVPTLDVSEAGTQMFREKVIAAAQECLASNRLDSGCGEPLPATWESGETLDEGTVKRSQNATEAAKLQSVSPTLGLKGATILSASYAELGTIDTTVGCRKDGQHGECTVHKTLFGVETGWYFGSPSIDVTDPDLKVKWE